MIKNPRNLLWLIPLLFFLTSPIWQPHVAAFLKPRGDFDSKVIHPEEVSQKFIMDSITITMSSTGRVDWVVNAEQAFTGESDRELKMVGVDARYTGRDNSVTHITSEQGAYFVDNRHLSLMDNVIISKPALNQEMRTELLHYYDDSKMAVSPGEVHIKAPGGSIRAGRMDYDLSSDAYDLSDRVVCQF